MDSAVGKAIGILEAVVEEADDAYDYATDTGGSRWVDLNPHYDELKEALQALQDAKRYKEGGDVS